MTGTTVNSYAASLVPAANAVPNVKGMAEKTQDFGAVLNKAAQKTEQPKETYKGKTDHTAQQKADAADQAGSDDKLDVKDQTKTAPEGAEKVKEGSAEEMASAEEPVDEMTTEEIADALSRIIEQLKEILGVTDEELLSTMEEIDMQLYDLLDPANMTQLVTALAGEDSAMSIVADEKLYAALQDAMDMVGTQVEGLLEETGLTGEELDRILEKLAELNAGQESESQEVVQMSVQDGQDASGLMQSDVSAVETTDGELSQGPVVIKEDHTQPEELPENQQPGPEEGDTKVTPQRTGQDAESGKHQESGSRDLGQAQSLFQNDLDNVAKAAAEGVESFTSENTESIMRQIADMVKIVRNADLTEMELQLHPASLGTVNVSLTTKGGVVTAEFTTQNEAVRAAIEAQASQLRANLEEQGIKIEAIEVSVASHQMERNLDRDQQGQQHDEQERRTERIQGVRRNSINLKAFEDGDELVEEMQGADDATRIAMEMMAANGNTMDLFA